MELYGPQECSHEECQLRPAGVHNNAEQKAVERDASVKGKEAQVQHARHRVAQPGQNLNTRSRKLSIRAPIVGVVDCQKWFDQHFMMYHVGNVRCMSRINCRAAKCMSEETLLTTHSTTVK